ncbi:MAG: C4-dicarboxylate ABC transporter substrate-binding protein, partial [Pseudomonadota bacterium]
MTRLAPARLLIAAAPLALIAPWAQADETFTVVGSWSSLPLFQQYEEPFWTKTLPQASDGSITVEMTTFNQMGVAGGDVFRLLDQGVFDVGMTVADYTVADAPALEGLDVPLIATDAATARKAVEAARPLV